MMKKLTRALCLIMCLAMVASVFAVCAFADENAKVSNHDLKDNALLAAYGIKCNSENNADGSNPDITSAQIVSANNDNAYLKVGYSTVASYSTLSLKDVPTTLTSYTYKIDLIVVEDIPNKYTGTVYGIGKNGKQAEMGFRIGAYVEEKPYSTVKAANFATVAEKEYFLGRKTEKGDLTGMNEAVVGETITFEMKVNSNIKNEGGCPTVTLTVSNNGKTAIIYNDFASQTLKECKIGFTGYKGFTYGFDNISVIDDDTGTVVYSEDFEDHAFAETLAAIDDDKHGYSCDCGIAVVANHSYDAGVEIDDETSCTTKKSVKYTCGDCEHEKIVPNAHTPGEPIIVEDTCSENGSSTVKCTVCGEVLEHKVIEGDGHDFGPWEKITNGKKRTCTSCGFVEEDIKAEETVAEQTVAETEATEEKGCGSVVAVPAIGALGVCVAAMLTKKTRKED